MARASRAELAAMHVMDAKAVLLKFADHAKPDPTFQAISSKHTNSWYGTSLLLAMRPWELAAFETLRQSPDSRVFPTVES